MKILPKSKKAISPPPQLTELIDKLLSSGNQELLATLQEVDTWKWPRSDLNAWIKVLNKFDSIMDGIIRDYNVDKLQLDPFSQESKDLLSAILRFERLLMENSTNRKTFSSYDRLNSLLSTSDLDILILALNLLLRPSQQYSSQPAVSHALSISTSRLQSLSKRWPHLREHGISLANLVSAKASNVPEIPVEAREVNFNFYLTETSATDSASKVQDISDVPMASPRKQSNISPSSTAIHIRLDESTVTSQPVMNVLAETIQMYSVPESETFDLLCRIRVAAALSTGRKEELEKLVTIRLLAIAIFGHTHSESQATSSLFLYEPDLIAHISELLHVDRAIPIPVQTAAIAALDALARYKNKVQEVLAAVNAGVNHGVLMGLVRNMVTEVANPDSQLPQSFVEAVLAFLTYIASHASGGNMVVGAGLIPLLIQIMENRIPRRLPLISKTMQLVDNILYSFANAFGLFAASRGVEVLVERIEYEVDLDIKDYATGSQPCALTGLGELPVQRTAVLKHILRSMHRMMQSSGTSEGLRGLIDMSLLKSIKKIFCYRGLFGPGIFPLGINIMSTFVHNEPTSLAIIQEAGLPEVFYQAMEIGVEPAIEVIQAIPNAIGALCLNEAGLSLLQKRPTIIPAIFAIFTSESHLKVLMDKENAVVIGTAVDELIRHHPTLKFPVFEALTSTLGKIEVLGLSFIPPPDIRHWYCLIPAASPESDNDVTMRDVERDAHDLSSEQTKVGVQDSEHEGEDGPVLSHDNIVVSFIDIIGRFLEGFFQHSPHCKDFVTTTDGLQRLGRLTSLPCLPYDFANSVASDSMVQVLRTMAEVATSETVLHLTDIVKESLDDSRFFWDTLEQPSKLMPFVDFHSDEWSEMIQQQFRSLVTLHIRITLLSDVFATAGQAQGRSAITLLQILMNSGPSQVLHDLGALHRASIWENIIFNAGLASKGIHLQSSASASSLEGSPNPAMVDLPIIETANPANASTTVNGAQPVGSPSANPSSRDQSTKPESPQGWNASALKHITQGLPNALAPFFQAMIKMFHARRNPDAIQRKQVVESSKIVAHIMLKHLEVKDFDDNALLFNYYSIIFALFSLLLVDERTSTNTVHTVELFAFYQAGGFDAIFALCATFISRIEELVKIKEEDRSETDQKELLHAYGAIKVALHLIYPVISSKSLLESGQTQLLITRDKSEDDPTYFEPHNFLVRLRTAALPTIRKLWEAPWLIQAPLGVSRYTVRTVLEIVNGENEESKADPTAMDAAPAALNISRPSGPDESRIRILTDMGFPRSAAERALIRTHNNVSSATELLLSQPFPLAPDPIPEIAASPNVEQSPEAEELPANQENATAPEAGDTTIPQSEEVSASASLVSGKNASEWLTSLDEAREALRQSISRQSLSLIDQHLSLLFDLHIAFTKQSKFQGQAVQDLVEDVKSFRIAAYGIKEQPLANRCRLLALVLCENPSSLGQELRNTLMNELLALLASCTDLEHPPKWLAAHLLVTEALFTLSEEPRSITLPKEGESILIEGIPVGPSRADARVTVFDFCLRLLAVEELPADEFLSALRLFVLLTRDRDMASEFVSRDGIAMLFGRLRKSAVSGGSSYVATILRHLVEDVPTIQNIMQQAVRRYFTQGRARPVDISTYVRSCSAIALRDIDLFIDTTKALCQLEQPFASIPHIRLQSDSATADTGPAAHEIQQDMQVDTPSVGPSNVIQKSVDDVISLLITELMNTTRLVNETPPTIAQGPALQDEQSADRPQVAQADDPRDGQVVDDMTQYLCFLMQCLTELLFSYDACKIAFLSFSTKRRSQQTPSKDHSKFRNVTLQFLLSEMVTYGTINPNPSSDAKQRNQGKLCSWAMNVIGALCADTSLGQDAKDISNDLMSVRRFVLETLSRAIKETFSVTDNIETRYGRMLALAELCHRLLTVRIYPNPRKNQEDLPSHLAKVMLEKNFVASLTNSLSEVDLNYPNVKNLVAAILRPLEYLTKVAIKMSKTSGKNKEQVAKDASVSEESMEDEEDETEDGVREETPDLYRNSALGMFAGEMDDGQYSEDEDMEEDEDEQDVEMDYGEETGSEDTSASESDEGDLEHVSRDSEEAWDEGEDDDEDDDDLVENPDIDEDDDEREGEEDEGEEEEEEGNEDDEDGEDEDGEGVMWEDIHGEADGLGLALEGVEADGGHGVPIQVNHEEDEPELASDEDEFLIDHGHLHHDGILNFGEAFVSAGTRDIGGWFARRHRGNDHPPFGRSRNPPTAPEAITHPLLLDMSSPSRTSHNISRTFRHASRIIGNGAPPPNLLQTIDEMLGQGSLQMLQQIISHEGFGADTFRIEVPAGTFLHHGRGFLGASTRPERVTRPHSHRQGREFDPMTTLQRWTEETKILHGDFVNERVGKLANHVALAMLPFAIEALKRAQAREQEEALQSSKDNLNSEQANSDGGPEAVEEPPVSSAPDHPAAMDSTAGFDSSPGPSADGATASELQAQDTTMRDAAAPESDAEMADASSSSAPPAPESSSTSGAGNSETQDPPERVTVLIHGSAVDITDTGIDPTFLEALPDDMREEVLNQHVRDQQASRIERPPDSQISAEFLDALPPEIRAEIIQQEAMERARRRSEEASRPQPREAADIDPASFIASLDPTLRQAVLLDQDDGFIQSLPSHMIAEAGAYRDELHAARPPTTRNPPRILPGGSQSRKHVSQHDSIPLLDRAGVAILVRLLFFPQVLKKNLLFKVLVNLCENTRTRTDLFNIILGILQDGTGDLAAVDKSFAQMSVRNREPKALVQKVSGKQKATPDYTSHLVNATPTETVPDVIAQRCLEALTFIVSTNEMSSLFFLTEHDIPVGIKKLSSKKGKGKEKQASPTHYPLVLLLNLLDKHSLLRTPPILESVVSLLAMVTRPLASLKDQAGGTESGPSMHANTGTAHSQSTSPEATPQNSTEQNTIDRMPPASTMSAPKGGPGSTEPKSLLPHAPLIPNSSLKLIVNILTIGDCSGRTFQQSLALIQHLSYIPDAREVIALELKIKAQEFGQTLYSDLDELVTALRNSDGNAMSSVAAKFSSASSTQAKLLRVLKTIDYMYTPKSLTNGTTSTTSDDIEKVQAIYESFNFTPLWRRLGDCLSLIGEDPAKSHIAMVLLPLIESLMVVCKYVGSKGSGSALRALRTSASPRSPVSARDSMEELFISFTDTHRKILNLMVRNNPSLMSGSFSLLVNNSRVLDFDNKRNYFNQQLHRKPHTREHYGTLQLNVRRARVFEDSFLYLQRKTGEQIKYGKLSVRFYDEEGVDAGGLTREWFQILARQMFNPNNALFQPCAADKLTYQPNKNSWVNPEHLSFFKFVGRVIGKAIYDGRLLDAYFARSLYRQLLGKPVDYRDVEWVDPEYYNSLCWILENDPTALDLTFSVEADEFGVNRIVPLKEGGESIPVTQENKREFVQLSAQYRLYSSIKEQIESLSSGFYEIIPKDLISIFNEQELELLISGTPDIDVDEWRAATEYNGYTSSDPNIVWWWRALKSFNREERAKVLSFATGTSRVPLSGFMDLQGVQGVQKFSIHRAYGEPDRLPQAHTCFNQIDLPQYTSYEMLRQQLLMAINEGGEGFAFS